MILKDFFPGLRLATPENNWIEHYPSTGKNSYQAQFDFGSSEGARTGYSTISPRTTDKAAYTTRLSPFTPTEFYGKGEKISRTSVTPDSSSSSYPSFTIPSSFTGFSQTLSNPEQARAQYEKRSTSVDEQSKSSILSSNAIKAQAPPQSLTSVQSQPKISETTDKQTDSTTEPASVVHYCC